jgi:hypothetical protein
MSRRRGDSDLTDLELWVVVGHEFEDSNFKQQFHLGLRFSVYGAVLNYVGNHGVHEAVQNPGLNAFFPTGSVICLELHWIRASERSRKCPPKGFRITTD